MRRACLQVLDRFLNVQSSNASCHRKLAPRKSFQSTCHQTMAELASLVVHMHAVFLFLEASDFRVKRWSTIGTSILSGWLVKQLVFCCLC